MDYAEPYSMHDMKLLMLHTSEHDDPAFVISIWGAIFDSCKSALPDVRRDYRTEVLILLDRSGQARPLRGIGILCIRVGATVLSFRDRVPDR